MLGKPDMDAPCVSIVVCAPVLGNAIILDAVVTVRRQLIGKPGLVVKRNDLCVRYAVPNGIDHGIANIAHAQTPTMMMTATATQPAAVAMATRRSGMARHL